MIVRESEHPVSEQELEKIEAKYGFKFPLQYRAFLLKNNGGRPERAQFQFCEIQGPYTASLVDWFLAVYEGKYDNFEMTFKKFKIDAIRMPPNFVPIGSDPFGNLICISVAGDDTGAVYFWDHEKEQNPDLGLPPARSNVFLIARSFNEFLESLI